MAHIQLFEDEDGTIWHDEQGESREVGSHSAYNYETDVMYTEAEVICESIAESTDETEGTYSIYSEAGRLIHRGTFTQDRSGVRIVGDTESEDR